MPASSAMRASRRLSGHEPDQRSGTSVTARPDEQFGPNKPILSALALCMLMRSRMDVWGASKRRSSFIGERRFFMARRRPSMDEDARHGVSLPSPRAGEGGEREVTCSVLVASPSPALPRKRGERAQEPPGQAPIETH